MINKRLYEAYEKEYKLARAKKDYRQKRKQTSVENFYKAIGKPYEVPDINVGEIRKVKE